MWTYQAKCIRVIDGDTLEMLVDLGFRVHYRVRIRLSDVDTPELRGPEKAAGERAKLAAEDWIKTHSEDLSSEWPFKVSVTGRKSFDRWEGCVFTGIVSRTLNEHMRTWVEDNFPENL